MIKQQLLKKINKKELVKNGYFLIGYDLMFSRLDRIVTKKGVNNAIIVGDSGVGKSALAQALIFKETHKFYEMQNDIISEVVFAYQPDKDEIKNIKNVFYDLDDAVIFIDDIATLFSTEYVFQNRLLNLLKILLENPSVSVIATIDQANYRLFVEKEPLLSKAFEIVKVFEPTLKLATLIIKNHLPLYEKSYKVKIAKSLASKIVILSNRYIHTEKQPAKSLNLLDEVCAYTTQNKQTVITLKEIKHIISERTGIPINEISLSDRTKLQKLEELTKKSVKGQEHALKKVAKVIRRSRAGIKDPKRPIGSFLFLGPSGVGKTFLAKTLAKIVYNDENALIRIDMSEFSEAHNVQRLVGAPPGYVGYEEGGQLTNPIWERPYSLILLDEIEKAHPRVFDIFLQLIDEGRLTDGQGKTVDFNNTIIIATSNIGIDFIIDNFQKRKNYILTDGFVQKEMMPLLLSYFRPEFINRFDDIVLFKPLLIKDLKNIANLSIEELNERLKDKDITIQIKEETLEKLSRINYNPKFGARPLKRAIREQIEDYIAHKIIFNEIENGAKLEW